MGLTDKIKDVLHSDKDKSTSSNTHTPTSTSTHGTHNTHDTHGTHGTHGTHDATTGTTTGLGHRDATTGTTTGTGHHGATTGTTTGATTGLGSSDRTTHGLGREAVDSTHVGSTGRTDANQPPYWGDMSNRSDVGNREKELPLRPNEQVGSTGLGGVRDNHNSVSGAGSLNRDHPVQTGTGLTGQHENAPYDSRLRDRDMGRENVGGPLGSNHHNLASTGGALGRENPAATHGGAGGLIGRQDDPTHSAVGGTTGTGHHGTGHHGTGHHGAAGIVGATGSGHPIHHADDRDHLHNAALGDTKESEYNRRIREGDIRRHDIGGTTGTGHHSTNAGPHDSNIANKADPRVDSDRDGRQGVGHHSLDDPLAPAARHQPGGGVPQSSLIDETSTGHHGTGHHGTGHHGTGHHGTGHHGVGAAAAGVGAGAAAGHHSTTAGPHSSNIANKADPRVDSDLDGRRGLGQNQGLGHNTHTTHTTHAGHSNVLGGTTTSHQTNAGPHGSNVANKVDPRVDSDLDGNRGLGQSQGLGHNTHTTHTGHGIGSGAAGIGSTTGYNQSTTAGPHGSNIANKADPRVDSDLDGRRGLGQNQGYAPTDEYGHVAQPGVGQSGYTNQSGHSNVLGGASAGHQTSTGPHNSNIANKIDPRVDSNLDGRRGLGQ